ncbi:hypothetical protein AGRA3207_005311 [Actinomadura graeca]|uniref:Uncharacterized protein n=1 Tax=Actinomadura graeca TaxID=2750812 RepID=A0ABX8QZ30_9ACTN|nr:hypothetical protein [Actinomadura graeca]QXJ24060.1 hypothetical protein AGRA3207_005311 [Actinomadura graeca]
MNPKVKHAVAAAATFVVAAAVNLVTGMLTQRASLVWVITLVALVVVGGAVEAWLKWSGGSAPAGRSRQKAHQVKVGGSVRQSMTESGEQTASDSVVDGDVSQRMSKPGEQNVTNTGVGSDLTQDQG